MLSRAFTARASANGPTATTRRVNRLGKYPSTSTGRIQGREPGSFSFVSRALTIQASPITTRCTAASLRATPRRPRPERPPLGQVLSPIHFPLGRSRTAFSPERPPLGQALSRRCGRVAMMIAATSRTATARASPITGTEHAVGHPSSPRPERPPFGQAPTPNAHSAESVAVAPHPGQSQGCKCDAQAKKCLEDRPHHLSRTSTARASPITAVVYNRTMPKWH